jgi:tumor protein p53-inducible protein 3
MPSAKKIKYFLNLLFLVLLSSISITGEELMQAVLYKPGGAEGLRVVDLPKPSVQDGHILIRIHYFAINRADILQRKGLYPPPKGESDILGLEAAGVIDDVGSNCSKPWRYVSI